MKAKKLDELKNKCLKCKKCELGETRNNIVFSDGNPKTARAILIGEAPGENEDKTGTPFVGRAGKLLNEFLEKAEISREKDLYIINTVNADRLKTGFQPIVKRPLVKNIYLSR